MYNPGTFRVNKLSVLFIYIDLNEAFYCGCFCAKSNKLN